jgi:hypothetical protein
MASWQCAPIFQVNPDTRQKDKKKLDLQVQQLKLTERFQTGFTHHRVILDITLFNHQRITFTSNRNMPVKASKHNIKQKFVEDSLGQTLHWAATNHHLTQEVISN